MFSLVAILCFTRCKEKIKKEPYQVPDDLAQIIAGDSLKTWKLLKRYNGKTRMNMGDCFLKYRQTFMNDGNVYDNNIENSDCGKSLKGSWKIIKDSQNFTYIRITSNQIPKLLGTTENYKDFRIFHASKDSLHLSFVHTQYGQKRRISDYLIDQDLQIKGRDFHHK
ncbi:lipocalin-like protein [Dokdonia sp. Hel_I_53]|nr:lipocalin-like protein [Dokdonia sp. Hel_I_53]